MPLVFRVNGADLGDQAVRLGSITGGFVSRAEKGTIGSGGLPIDDPTGVLNIVGLQPFTVDETSSSGGTRMFTGYLQDRTLERGVSSRSTSLLTGAARLWDCNVVDLNAILNFRTFVNADANRPAETVNARMAWLMTTLPMALVHDHGFIDSSTINLSANDFRGNYPVDVLNDIVNVAAFDYYLFWNQGTSDVTLYLGDPTAATRVSTISISNVLTDQTSTTLYPLIDAKLLRDPSRVYSGVLLQYNGGSTYQTLPSTAVTFGVARDVVVSTSRIGKASTAVGQAKQFLASSSTEADRISCTLKLPASQVNLVDAGMRINAKFTHLAGYESGKNMRVALRQVKADEETDQFYNVYLELITPIVTNYSWFGGGSVPDLPPVPVPPGTTPACLSAISSVAVVDSSDGTYPISPCGTYDNVVASRKFCHDESVGNPCGIGNALFWGVTTNGREQKTLSYTPPVGAVLARVTASVGWDNSTAGGSANAHGWHVNVVGNPPAGWQDGSTFLSSSHPTNSGDMTITTAYIPANLFDGSIVYFITYPNWAEAEGRVCGGVGDPFPGGGYISTGAVISVDFMGFCTDAVGLANWVGGIGAVDGTNATFTLISWDGTGLPQAKVNGLPTPVTANPADSTVTFNNAPAAGSLVTFNYNVGPTAPVEAPPPGVIPPGPPSPGWSVPFGSRPASAAISRTSVSNQTISNLQFTNTAGPAITLDTCTNVVIDGCDFTGCVGGVYAINCTNITVQNCRYSEIGDGTVGSGHSNFVQFSSVTDGYIGHNKGKGGLTEDIVSIYQSSGSSAASPIVMEFNQFQGTDWTSTSGSAFQLGDSGGSHMVCRNNTMLTPGQSGIGVPGTAGSDITVADNICYGAQRTSANVGISIGFGAGSCSLVTVVGNQVKWFNAAGAENPYYDGGNCGTPTLSSNDFHAPLDPTLLTVTL